MDRRLGIGLIAGLGLLAWLLGLAVGSALNDSGDGSETASSDGAAEASQDDDPGGDDPDGGAPDDETAEPTTTAADPLMAVGRVTLAGDSVMAGLEPALSAALGAGEVDSDFILTPSVLRDATIRFTWGQRLEEFGPDVIVMLVGTWEAGAAASGVGQSTGGLEDPAWGESYVSDVLQPWADLLTADGAEVVWIGAPVTADEGNNFVFAILNAAYKDLAESNDGVHYIESSEVLSGDDGGYTHATTLPSGEYVRTRQTDGLHLCAQGAIDLAQAVLDEIGVFGELSVPPGWEQGDWRLNEAYPPEYCPAP